MGCTALYLVYKSIQHKPFLKILSVCSNLQGTAKGPLNQLSLFEFLGNSHKPSKSTKTKDIKLYYLDIVQHSTTIQKVQSDGSPKLERR